MKDLSLVAFTLLSQMAVGAFWVLSVLYLWATRQVGAVAADALLPQSLWAVPAVMAGGILASFFHLGSPREAWRAFANLRSSWLSREILFALLFTGAAGLFAVLQWFDLGTPAARSILAWAAGLLGLSLLVSMANAYRLRTVPAWNTWATPALLFITAFLLGGLAAGSTLAIDPGVPLELSRAVLQWIALGAVVLLGIELVVILLWIANLMASQGAARRAAARITQEHGRIFKLRLALSVGGMVVAGIALSPWGQGAKMGTALILALGLALASEVLGRLLFYEARERHGV